MSNNKNVCPPQKSISKTTGKEAGICIEKGHLSEHLSQLFIKNLQEILMLADDHKTLNCFPDSLYQNFDELINDKNLHQVSKPKLNTKENKK